MTGWILCSRITPIIQQVLMRKFGGRLLGCFRSVRTSLVGIPRHLSRRLRTLDALVLCFSYRSTNSLLEELYSTTCPNVMRTVASELVHLRRSFGGEV